MRHARLTWEGAFHHVMNRGHNLEKIFINDNLKSKYIQILSDSSSIYKINIYGFCIMDNHYHLILQNTSGRLSEFMKHVNARYGIFYRKIIGGKGYIFHDRFKSTLIQNNSYLIKALIYILQNPFRKGTVTNPLNYDWSSAFVYFNDGIGISFIDKGFVEELFSSFQNFQKALLETSAPLSIQEKNTKYGRFLSNTSFIKTKVNWFENQQRNIISLKHSSLMLNFHSKEKIIEDFQSQIGKPINKIKVFTHDGKRQRGQLLILLREKGGLKYSEIYKIGIFSKLSFNSLGRVYQLAKKRIN